jgi:2-methylcitrate dehydratase PrpD
MATARNRKRYRYGRPRTVRFKTGTGPIAFKARDRVPTGANRPPAGGATYRDKRGRYAKRGKKISPRQDSLF